MTYFELGLFIVSVFGPLIGAICIGIIEKRKENKK